MATVAEQFRAAREAQGLTIHQVAEVTKLRTDHVRALEAGDYGVFAAPVYVRGFARTYARLLHLDPEGIGAALDAELRQAGRLEETAMKGAGQRGLLDALMLQFSKVNWRVVLPTLGVAVFVLALILGYRAWANFRHRDPLATLGPGQHQPARPDPAELLPVPTNAPRRSAP